MEDSKQSEGPLNELLARNDLIYEVPRDASLVAERTFKEYPFDNSAYTAGGRPIIQLNTSGDYIYGPTSYLAFDLSISGGDATSVYSFGSASAAQLFSEVIQESSSGQNLELVQRSDIVNYVRHKYQSDASLDEKWGGVTGAGRADLLVGKAAGDEGDSVPLCVPMSMISKLWAQSEPLPASLCAGMQIKLVLNTKLTALKREGNVTTATQYHVRNLRIVCDSMRLRDAAVKELQMQSANNPSGGLKYTYSTFFTTPKDVGETLSTNIDVQKSATVPVRVMAVCRATADIKDDTADAVDSYLSYADSAADITQWQVRSGSVYLPQQPITDSARSYMYTNLAFDKVEVDDIGYRKALSTQVSYKDDFIAGKGWILAMPLYKSPSLPLSSDPTNNSRLINFQASRTTGTKVTWDIIIEYIQVANVMLNNVVVDH